MSILHIKCR